MFAQNESLALSPPLSVDAPKPVRPRVGLALSGGGARGAAHIGVLKALEAQGIPIDCIAGTSMGAIVGGLYAAGQSPTEIETTFSHLNWGAGFRDKPQRQDLSFRRKQDDKQFLLQFDVGFRDGKFRFPRGLVQGQNLNIILKTLVNRASVVRDFDQLRVPFRAVAADLETGDARILKSGDLAEAVRASMTIPGVYEPVERDGYLLVDGGVADNLPVHVVRQLCADIVIAVDVSSPLLERNELGSLVDVVDQLSTLLTRRNTEASISLLRDGDIYLRPDLSGIAATDFNKIKDAIGRGADIAQAHKDWLQDVAARTGTVGATKPAVGALPAPLPVQRIALDNSSGLATKAILARLGQDLGEPFEEKEMHRDLNDLYGTGVFGVLDYEQIKIDDGIELLLHTPENPLGPHYFRFGLQLEDNFSGDSVYNLGVRHTYMPANEFGGEWRNELQIGSNPRVYSEWFQPISVDGRWFISASGEWQRRSVQERNDKEIHSELSFTGDIFRGEFGHQFGAHGHVLVGLRKGSGDLEERIGSSGLNLHGLDVGEAYLHTGIDRLDNRYFPRRGRAAALTLARGSEQLGADIDYKKAALDWLEVKTYGRHTIGAQLLAGSFVNDEAPLQEQFQLGGFLRLSGYSKNELLGEHLRLLNGYYLYRLDQQLNATLDLPVYVGGSLEYGNVWQRKADISERDSISAGSIFIGIDTQLGPLYLAYGKNSEQRDALYLYLGAPF